MVRLLTSRIALAVALAGTARAQTIFQWQGGNSSLYATGSNWAGNVAPDNNAKDTDLLLSGSPGRPALSLPTGTSTVHGISVTTPGVSYSLAPVSGNLATLAIGTGGLTTTGSSSVKFTFGSALPLQLLASQTWTTGLDVFAQGAISGAATLTKAGSGKLVLGGSNTFSGGLIVNAGTVALGTGSGAGTGAITLATGTTLAPFALPITVANAVSVGNNVTLGASARDQSSLSLTLTGTITAALANVSLQVPADALTFFNGELTGPSHTTFTFAGGGTAILGGTTGNAVDSIVADGTAVIFASKSTLPGVAVQAVNAGYIGIGRGFDGSAGNLTPASLINKITNQSSFNGTLGFDTDPNDSAPAVFNQAINTSGFTGSGFTGIGSLTSAVISGNITPPSGGNYKFGGGDGILYVSSSLSGSTGLTLASSTSTARPDERLTLYLQGTNSFTGGISVTGSTLIFDSAGALPTGAVFNLGRRSYVGYTANATGVTSFANFLTKVTGASGSQRTADSIIGLDSASVAAPRTVSDAIDLSPLASIYLGTATKVILSGPVTAPADHVLRLTGVNRGHLKITSALTSAQGIDRVTIGSADAGSADPAFRGIVELTSSTGNYSGGTTLSSGYLLLGASSTLSAGAVSAGPLGTGALTIPSGAAQPTLAASANGVALHNNLSLASPGLVIGVPTTTDSSALAFSLQSLRANDLTLHGVISGTGGFTYAGLGSTLTLTGANTFAGNVTVTGGTLRIGAANTLPATAYLSLQSGSTLDVAHSQTIAGFFGSDGAGASLVLGAGQTFTVAMPVANTVTTFAGSVSGGGVFAVRGAGNDIVHLTGSVTNTGGTLVGSGATLIIGSGGTVSGPITAEGTLTFGDTGTQIYTGTISGSGAIVASAGTTVLSGANEYTGGTVISGGTIIVSNTTGSATGSGTVSVGSGGVLGGSGIITGPLVLSSGGTVAPGNSPGILTVGTTTFAGGANFTFDLNSVSGVAGTNWDLLSVSGGLTIAATQATPFVINLVSLNSSNASGLVSNFNFSEAYSWTFVNTTGGVTGFAAGAFQYNLGQFQNSLGSGSFFVTQSGNNLVLNFTPIPEPSTWALLIAGLGLLAFGAWRKRK